MDLIPRMGTELQGNGCTSLSSGECGLTYSQKQTRLKARVLAVGTRQPMAGIAAAADLAFAASSALKSAKELSVSSFASFLQVAFLSYWNYVWSLSDCSSESKPEILIQGRINNARKFQSKIVTMLSK